MIAVDFFAPGIAATKGSARGFFAAKLKRVIIRNDSTRAKPWAATVSLAAERAMAGRAPLAGPVAVEVEFFLPRPKSHMLRDGRVKEAAPSHRTSAPDIDKLLRCALDALTGIVFVDDAQIVRVVGEKPYAESGRVGARIVVRTPDMCGGFGA